MSEEPQEEAMTLWEHLAELRSRLVKMMVTFVIGAGISWAYKEKLLEVLTLPFVASWNPTQAGGAPTLHFQTPASGFIAYVKLSALAGLVFSLPLMFYQVWAFVAPGLYAKEKRFAIPFVLSSFLLFVAGGYFCFTYAFPPAFKFLIGQAGLVGSLHVQPTVMLDEYISFVMNMLLAFGCAAELPVVAFFLSVIGVVTHKDLIKFFRYWVVIAFVIAAVVTPPDPLSQFMLAVPLCGLYGVSIIVAWIFGKKRPAVDADVETPAVKSR
jgi:sec-independent protein translocase protein TatC